MRTVAVRKGTHDVMVDRTTRWGNPFTTGTRDEVVERHRVWLDEEIRTGRVTLDDLRTLEGKRLGCHCKPLPCHADNIADAVERHRVHPLDEF